MLVLDGAVYSSKTGRSGRVSVPSHGLTRAAGPLMEGAVMENCIEWTGHKWLGYGYARKNGKTPRAHRMVWEEKFGPIPIGIDVHHKCHNKGCVNINHLELMPHGKHISMHNARTDGCKRGHPWTEANLIISARGHRSCRICKKNCQKEYRK
jgi:hypothetical protein